MRIRLFVVSVFVINALQLMFYFHKQTSLAYMMNNAEASLDLMKQKLGELRAEMEQVVAKHSVVVRNHSAQFKKINVLLKESRRNFIRIKGVKEKADENLEEKIVEMASFLDIRLTTSDIERANRIGAKRKNGERIIVAQLSNYKLKRKLIRKASAASGMIEFSIQDDATSYVIPAAVGSRDTDTSSKSSCGFIGSVDTPVVRSKSPTLFGAWLQDPSLPDIKKSPIWVLRQFYENKVVEEFATLRDLAHHRPRASYDLPYEWAGTGHVVGDGFLYFNKFNSSLLVKYSFDKRSVEVERHLPEAVFGNIAPYQWSGSTDIDLSLDELGLWVIYSTLDNALDIVVSKLDTRTLEVLETFRTNWRKQWSGNAFVACGVLYAMKKYDDAETYLSFMYDTKTKKYKHIEIPFRNSYEWNTMLSYNHGTKLLYAWDRGYLVSYNFTFESKT